MRTEGGILSLRSLLSTPYPVRQLSSRTVTTGGPTCCAEEPTFDWSRNAAELKKRKLSAIRKSMLAQSGLVRKFCDICKNSKIRGDDTSPEGLGKMFEHWSQAAWGPPPNSVNLKGKKRACNDCIHLQRLTDCVPLPTGIYIGFLSFLWVAHQITTVTQMCMS